jgi:hypothetical protein
MKLYQYQRPKIDLLDRLIAKEYKQTVIQVLKEVKQDEDQDVVLVYQCKGE